MDTAEEIQVLLTAQTAQLKAGMAEGAAVVKSTQDEMAASMAASMNAFRDFDAIQKGSITTAAELASAQQAVTAAQASGAFTAEELAAKQALVDAAMLKVSADAKGAAASMAVLGGSSRTAYSASALISDAMTGQFSRSRREVAALANETGLMSRALRLALSPAGLAAGAVGFLGLSTIKAEEDLNDFNNAVERTNGYMGASAGELQAAAQKIESLGVSYSDAKQAVLDLANSGRFTGEQLLQAATSAAEFAQLTGEKVGQVDKLMVEMATNPQKALDELVEKYHRVTPAQAEVIEGLIKQGDKAAATAALVQAMGTSVAASFDKQAQHAGMLDKVLTTLGRDFGEVWRGIGESLNVATGGGDAAEKLTVLQHQLANMRASGETTGGYAVAYQALQKQAAELQTIIDKQHQSAAAAKQMADAYAQAHPAQGTFAAFQKNGLEGIDVNGNLTRQLQTAEAAMKTSYGNREQFEEEYWGTVLQRAQSGSAAYIQAWQHVQSLQQQLDERQLHASEEADRKSAQSAKEAAKQRTRAYSQATQELEEEAKREAAAMHAADEQVVESAHTLATAKINASLQADKTLLANGQIVPRQMYEDQIDALNKQLTADVQFYQSKAKLAAGDAAEVMKWQSAILVDVEKTNAAMLKVQRDYADQVNRINREIADEKIRNDQRTIESGFREINQLIGRQETFKQALANIGMEILQTQEENVAKGIAEAFNGEQGKTAAAEAGAAERLGITVAGEAQALAVQAASAIKWITTEAAKAAAGAFNAMVSIPVIGPFVAVGASIAAGAAVMALVGKVASAEGGWERVPADGMMTQLHKDEMVLPARIAEPVRRMAKNGGAAGGTHHHHYTINAYDRRGLADFVARNGIELGNGLRRLGRNGHQL